MGKKTIKILDAVHCKANPEARKTILPLIKYQSSYLKRKWVKSAKGTSYCIKEKEIKTSHLITGRDGTSGTFLSGLLPRILKNNPDIEVQGEFEKLIPTNKKPSLPNITFRKDQLRAIKKIRSKQRGILVFPTGSGKTLIAIGLMNVFSAYRILFLCHTKELVRQTSEELSKFNMQHFILGDNNKINWVELEKKSSCILVSTIQSFSKIPKSKWMHFFDITIVDEVHHATKEKSGYGKVMLHNLSPIKIGLTATVPSNEHEKLVMEGFFGPLLYELTNQKGEEIGIIAQAKVKLLSVPYKEKLTTKLRPSYKEIYDAGIVTNKTRNDLILEEVQKSIKRKEGVLIIVEKIEHGKVLENLMKKNKINCPFVHGESKSDFRSNTKTNLKNETLDVAICTKVWKEGVNIPALKKIILAAGMKEEKAIKQAMGRGLRTTESKKKIKLIDFMDPYPYLAQHSVIRFSIYQKLGWL